MIQTLPNSPMRQDTSYILTNLDLATMSRPGFAIGSLHAHNREKDPLSLMNQLQMIPGGRGPSRTQGILRFFFFASAWFWADLCFRVFQRILGIKSSALRWYSYLVVASLFKLGIWFRASHGFKAFCSFLIPAWQKEALKVVEPTQFQDFAVFINYNQINQWGVMETHDVSRCVCACQHFFSILCFLFWNSNDHSQTGSENDIWNRPFQWFPRRIKMLLPWAPWALVSCGIIPPALALSGSALMLWYSGLMGSCW